MRRGTARAQGELFAPEAARPPGFAYAEGLISRAEEQAAVERFADLPFRPFDFHGHLGKRRIVSFGWRYDYGAARLEESAPIPPFLLALRCAAAGFAGVPATGLQQVLVTEYAPGAGIGWHRDKAMFEDVIAVSFLSAARLRFRRRQSDMTWERAAQELRARSVYLLRGPARRAWEHSIPPVDRLRYSVTFRNFAAGPGSDAADSGALSRPGRCSG